MNRVPGSAAAGGMSLATLGAPMPTWFETDEEVDEAVADLAALAPAARTLLSKAIETQGYTVTKVSPAARTLEDLGFVFVRELTPYDTSARITPSLWGEEALDRFEARHAAKVSAKANKARSQAAA